MRAVIVTVGTSLLTAFRRTGVSEEGDLLEFLERNYPGVSAEANSLQRMDLAAGKDYLYFVSSGDEECRRCAAALAAFYQKRGFIADERPIAKLTKMFAQFRDVGLRDFVYALADIIEMNEGRCVICATGGFKAEIAYATVVGLIYGLTVYYLHEDFKGIVELPMMPVGFDFSLFSRYRNALEAIVQAPTRKEAAKLTEQLPVAARMLVQREETGNGYNWSPLGAALHRAYIHHLSGPKGDQIPIAVYKQHTHLWGDGDPRWEDIRDDEVRTIFRRLGRLPVPVKRIQLDEFNRVEHSDEVYMRFWEKGRGSLKYKLLTKEGMQFVRLETEAGLEDELLELLGRKVYA